MYPMKQPEFGGWFKAQRQAAGITRKQIADASHVSEITVENIERGMDWGSPTTRDLLIATLDKLRTLKSRER